MGTSKPAKFYIRPRGFELFPDNAEMMGGSSLPIKVVVTDGSDPFASVVFDYQMVWETPGKFGLFNGVTRSLTEDTTNSVRYEALEEEEEGSETISVAIYSKLKGEPGPFSFEDRVSGSIDITNDENRQIYYVPNYPISGSEPSVAFLNYFVRTVFDFAPVAGAQSYEMTIIEHNPSSVYIGASMSWAAGDPDDLTDGVYRLTTSRSSGSVPKGLPDAEERVAMKLADALAFHSSINGLAKVVVLLMP